MGKINLFTVNPRPDFVLDLFLGTNPNPNLDLSSRLQSLELIQSIRNPLCEFVFQGYEPTLSIMEKCCLADPTMLDPSPGRPVGFLHAAVWLRSPGCVGRALDMGANPLAKSFDGVDAVSISRDMGRLPDSAFVRARDKSPAPSRQLLPDHEDTAAVLLLLTPFSNAKDIADSLPPDKRKPGKSPSV